MSNQDLKVSPLEMALQLADALNRGEFSHLRNDYAEAIRALAAEFRRPAPMVEQREALEMEVPAVVDLGDYKVETIVGGVKVLHLASGIRATAWHHTSNGALWKAIGAIYGRLRSQPAAATNQGERP